MLNETLCNCASRGSNLLTLQQLWRISGSTENRCDYSWLAVNSDRLLFQIPQEEAPSFISFLFVHIVVYIAQTPCNFRNRLLKCKKMKKTWWRNIILNTCSNRIVEKLMSMHNYAAKTLLSKKESWWCRQMSPMDTKRRRRHDIHLFSGHLSIHWKREWIITYKCLSVGICPSDPIF